MKWRSPRHNETNRGAIEMLDCMRSKLHRQLRDRRQERACGEIDIGTNRAINVIPFVAGVLRGQRLRGLRSRCGDGKTRVDAMNAVEMDMPE